MSVFLILFTLELIRRTNESDIYMVVDVMANSFCNLHCFYSITHCSRDCSCIITLF